MRSLFIKIFFWFWLANTLVVGALVLTTIGTPDKHERRQMRAVASHMITLDGEKAVATLLREGQQALRQQIERIHDSIGVRLFVYNESGEELLSQSAPAGARELALKAVKSGVTEESRPENLVAQRIIGPDGRNYTVVARMSPGPFADVFATPYALLLRMAAVILMAGVVCYGLARYLTGPLRRLRASAQRIAGGDLSVRVGTPVSRRHDEIGSLARDFDLMAERIEALVSTQRRLISDMSHELRSPLARLNLALGLVRQRTGPEATEMLDRMEREAQRLNELIEQILTLARLEGRSTMFEKSPLDLAALLGEVVADVEFEAQEHKRHARLIQCDDCTINGNLELLRSALENVIRNGMRYTPDDSAVEVSLCCRQDGLEKQAIVRVRDHGPGIPENAVTDIFQPFYRVADDRGRGTGGIGLGLAIARQAVRIHGGMISAANTSEGGLVVKIILPLHD